MGQTLPICMRNSGFSIIKSVANLKISWSFLLEKILRSTRTLDCDKYRLKLKGRFFSFCWAIFLYFSTPLSWVMIRNVIKSTFCGHCASIGDIRTICRFSYMKVYKLITLGTKFKTLLGRKITRFSKLITNYIEQGWWHSSLSLKCMHLLLKEVNKRGRHAYNLHRWTRLPSGIVMEIHCHIKADVH